MDMLRGGREEEEEEGEIVLGWKEYRFVSVEGAGLGLLLSSVDEEGVEDATGTRPRPPEETLRTGEVTADSH